MGSDRSSRVADALLDCFILQVLNSKSTRQWKFFKMSFPYFRCVRAFGNRDAVHHAFEFGSIHSPEFLSPDSNCGQIEAKKDGNQAEETFFSYPPAKRENLVMLKCPFPFQVDWKLLLNHSSTTFCPTGDTEPASDLFVLRDHRILTEISGALKASKETSFLLTSVPEASRCLVGVRVKIVGKGKPTPLSMICLPCNFVSNFCFNCHT